jgi:ABC-type transporter Mla MlaB component
VKANPTFEIAVDAPRNFARIQYFGKVTATHMPDCVAQIAAHLPQLRAGFTVLVDLSRLDGMDLDCVPYISNLMDLCRVQGVGTIIRVIPDPSKDIGLNILSLIHYRGQVHIVTCDTLDEAEKLLV